MSVFFANVLAPREKTAVRSTTLLRIVFGLMAIGWIVYCFYLGFLPSFGSALIVVYTLVLAALFSFIDLIWKWIRG